MHLREFHALDVEIEVESVAEVVAEVRSVASSVDDNDYAVTVDVSAAAE